MTAPGQQTVLVAGGAGFIGSHLCERLIGDGRRVVCLDNLQTGRRENLARFERDSRFDLIEADVADPLPDAVSRVDQVFNLACAASPTHYRVDPEHTLLTSVLGTSRLLRLAAVAGAPLLLASTSEVYGDPEVHPQHEDYRGAVSCTGPRACYDEGKRAAETLCFDADRLGQRGVRVARIFNTYGPRIRPDDGRVVPNFIRQALSGEPITIHGDGSQTRSFTFVDDVVEGLIRLARIEGPQPGPVNLGNPGEITIADLARQIRDLTGADVDLTHLPRPIDDPSRRCPDIGRARLLLDWEPRIGLREGLERTIVWMKGDIAG